MVAILCVATCHLHYEVARWVSGAYLENKGGGCLVAREARRDFGHALLPHKKVTFTAISHDNDNNAYMCIGVVITQ